MSSCACIKKDFNLFVDSLDCRTLVIEDQSKWMNSTGFSRPSTYDVEIIILDRGTKKTITIDANKRNLFSSIDLWDSTEELCLSDGIFCFSTESCGVKYTINRAYLCNTKCAIDTYSSRVVTEEDSKNYEEVNLLLNSVESNINIGRLEVAKRTFKILQDKLEKLGCSKNCCGK